MEFLKPDSVMSFGKHKGKTVRDIFGVNPNYLYWLVETGYTGFGSEITEAIIGWESLFPEKARKVKANIELKKQEQVGTAKKKDPMDKALDAVETIIQSQQIAKAIKDPLFGSW